MSEKWKLRLVLIFLLSLTLGVGIFFTIRHFQANNSMSGEKTENIEEPGTVHLLGGFETSRELYSLKPLETTTIAKLSIYGEDAKYVKQGKSSLRYEYMRRGWPGVLMYVERCSYPELNISNLNKIGVSVYSEADKKVEATMAVVLTNGKSLLQEEYTLEPGQWNELEFRLSAIACKYNAENIIGFSLRIENEETATFYIDNWTATMGAENTEEDNLYEALIVDIIERINKLPENIKMSDGEALEQLYMDYVSLPELYRNIIPNADALQEAIEKYVTVKYEGEEDGLIRKFLAYDEFYGIGMISNGQGGNYPILYQEEVHYKDEKGSTMITFDGSTTWCYLTYESPLSASKYDYVEISFYNDDDVIKTISFDYKYPTTLYPRTWQTIRIPGSSFSSKGTMILQNIQDGVNMRSSGKLYIGTMYAHRSDLLQTLETLPNASKLQMPRDIKYVTQIELAKKLYDAASETDKAALSATLVKNMEACYSKLEGYSTAFNVNTDYVMPWTTDVGPISEGTRGYDNTYGPVYKLKIQKNGEGSWSAMSQIYKDLTKCENMFFYIYNPKSTVRTLHLKRAGSWETVTDALLQPGWNKIQIPNDKALKLKSYTMLLFDANEDVTGEWMISNIYQMSAGALLNQLIDGLPNVNSIVLPDGLKYAAIVDEAKRTYDKLDITGELTLTSSRKSKLNAWLNKLKGYTVVFNSRLDEMQVGQYGNGCKGVVTRSTDGTYGSVYDLHVTGPDGNGGTVLFSAFMPSPEKAENVFFYIYNPTDSEKTLIFYNMTNKGKNRQAVSDPQIMQPGWNMVELTNKAKYEELLEGFFHIGGEYDPRGTWKITSFYGRTNDVLAQHRVQELSKMIDELPGVDDIRIPRDLETLTNINAIYTTLTEKSKSLITPERMTKFEKIQEVYLKHYKMLYGMSNILAFTRETSTYPGHKYVTLTSSADATYGNVLKATFNSSSPGENHLVIKYKKADNLEKQLSEYDKVYFYVYNPRNEAMNLMCDFGGSLITNYAVLTANAWTKVEVPVADFISGSFFGILNVGYQTGPQEFLFSAIWAESYLKTAQSVANLIDELPEAEKIVMPEGVKYMTAIQEVKEQYDALPKKYRDTFTDKQKAKLTAWQELLSDYKILYSMSNIVAFSKETSTYPGHKYVTLTTGANETYGNVLKATFNSSSPGENHLVVKYKKADNLAKQLSEYDKVCFYVYNPRNEAMNLMCDFGGSLIINYAVLTANAWTKVEVPVADFISGSFFGILNVGFQTGPQEFLFSTIWTESYLKTARSVANLIDELPEAEKIVMPEGVKYMTAIQEVKEQYDALPKKYRDTFTDKQKAKLTAWQELLSDYKVLYSMSNIVAFSKETSTYPGHKYVTLSSSADATYGNVLKATFNSSSPGENHLVVKYKKADNLAEQLSGYDKVCFYVYNPRNEAVNLMCDFGGSLIAKYTVLTANAWTKVEVPVADFISGSFFGILNVGFQTGPQEFLFSAIWAESYLKLARSVTNIINKLPEVNSVEMPAGIKYIETVNEAVAAYEVLSEETRAYISDADKAKLAAWNEMISEYKVVANTTATMDFSAGTYRKVKETSTITVGTDDEYGSVFELNITGTEPTSTASNTVFFTIKKNMKGYKNVYFYIYNPMTSYRDVGFVNNNDSIGTMRLKPGWNLVTLDGSKLVNTHFTRVYFGGNPDIVGTWKVTSFYGETESELRNVDFFVEVEEGREPVVLQITDPQIIDSSQARTDDRLGSSAQEYWAPENKALRCYNYLTEIIKNTNPDLILVTGDIIYGEFDDAGSSWTEFIEFMDTFEIPWAPIFGNHENESAKGVEWQCEQLEKSVENGYCLFKQGTLTGNGNYTVGIMQGGKLQRVFFMMDSNGCADAKNPNAQLKRQIGFGDDQIAWYKATAEEIKEVSPDTKFSVAMHIQTAIFADAMEAYGYDKDGSFTPINIDAHTEKKDGDFGYLGSAIGGWDTTYSVWNGWKEMGVDSVFVGHQHENSTSVVYEGIRLQYGQKSSTYDSTNFIFGNESITGGVGRDVKAVELPLVGGTVMKFSEEDGTFSDAYIYMCVNQMSEMIDELPEADSISIPRDIETIATINAFYNMLTDESKSVITPERVTKFAKIQEAYLNHYKMLYGMSNIAAFSKDTGTYPGYKYVTLASGADATYGNVLKATFNSSTTGDNHLVIKYKKADNLAEQLSGYEKVCFYVYNPRNDARNLMCDFGGSLNTKYAVLAANAWTKVEVPVADFISGSFFGVLSVGYQTGPQEFLFSAIWAEKDLLEAEAQFVASIINKLPEANSVEMPAGIKYIATVNEATTAYDALPETAKTYISDADKAKLTAWQEKVVGYTLAVPETTLPTLSAGNFYNTVEGTISAKKDAEYGSYYELDITGLGTTNTKTHTIFFTMSKDLRNYQNIYFYVYNPLSSARTIGIYSGTEYFVGSTKLQPGWNLVSLDGTKIQYQHYLRVYFAETKEVAGTWKVTNFYGKTKSNLLVADVANLYQFLTKKSVRMQLINV